MKSTMRSFKYIIPALLTIAAVSGCTPKQDPQAAKIELGKKLYFDTRLSSTGQISCNTCHNVFENGADKNPVAVGVNDLKGKRNSPTVFNSGFWSAQFWDGRAATLEEQAKGPMINEVEMGMKDHDAVVETVKGVKGYTPLFKAAFPDESDKITIDTIANAIAEYERTLTTLNSPYDRYQNGDTTALSDIQKKGMQTFQNVGCASCHSGPHFAGPDLPKGQPFLMKFPLFTDSPYVKKYDLMADKGKAEETKNASDEFLWRVPSLRNVAETAPYFHNGSVTTLEEAIQVMASTQLNRKLTKEEVTEIAEFLKSLSGTLAAQQTTPELPQ